MAIDTVYKRVTAANLYPQTIAVWPSGEVDRLGASWMYNGIPIGAAAAVAVVELLSLISEVITTIMAESNILMTKTGDSDIMRTIAAESNI